MVSMSCRTITDQSLENEHNNDIRTTDHQYTNNRQRSNSSNTYILNNDTIFQLASI